MKNKSYCGLLLLAFVGALTPGCDTSPVETELPTVVSSTVYDEGPIFRTVFVELSDTGQVEVEYWSGSEPHLIMQSPQSAATHVLPLPRLHEKSNYSYRIRTVERDQGGPWMPGGTFQTGDLPSDIRAMTFTTEGAGRSSLVFLSVRSAFNGGLIADENGRVVWYARTAIPPQGFTRRANGNWVIVTNGNGLSEFSALGKLVAFLPQANTVGYGQIHHSVVATPQNTILFLTFEPKVFNGTTRYGEGIWEWNPETGSVVRRWTAFDFLNPEVDRSSRSRPDDWLHANSISVGTRGNVIVSLHYLDQILSVAPDFRSIEWRVGGVGSTYSISATQATSGQHSAFEVAPNTVLLFDNGYERADGARYSRALELRLDPSSKAVVTRWEYRPTPDIFSWVISSARRASVGTTVVTFGSSNPVEVHEVSESGALLWRMVVGMSPGGTVFHGDAVESIGGERVVR